MDENALMKTADLLSTQKYKIDALIHLFIEKNIFSKEEFNTSLCEVIQKSENEKSTDEYVIEELKNKVLLK